MALSQGVNYHFYAPQLVRGLDDLTKHRARSLDSADKPRNVETGETVNLMPLGEGPTIRR